MENKKNLRIDTAICDIRNVTEELLSQYEKVRIDTASLITSPEAQMVIAKCGVEIDAATTNMVETGAELSVVNGTSKITPNQTLPEKKVFLLVNGSLSVEPGSEEILKSYVGITVNGSLTCPESMAGLLSTATVNGSIRTYPDGAILLKRTTVLDRTFHLRAKQDALYYAASRIVALAPDIDFARLTEKNVRFATKQLIVAESLAEAAVPLFDEKADILILPDGCAYVDDSAELNEQLVKRCGGKLYIDGNLSITPDSAAALEQISYLRVDGSLLVCKSMKEQMMAMDILYDELHVVGGVLVHDRGGLTVSRDLLEHAAEGVSICDCGAVQFQPDIPAELIREKLVSICDCGAISCTEEQEAAITAAAHDVGYVGPKGFQEEEDSAEEDENTVRIDAALYIL